MSKTVAETLKVAASRIGGDSARADSEILLSTTLGRPRSWLFAHADDPVSGDNDESFQDYVSRRVAGEPIALITGAREFWSLSLQVSVDTLIPRHETERLVELALDLLDPVRALDVLDLGTGSGAIALAIAKERPLAAVCALDRSPAALKVAQSNAIRLGLKVQFLHGDWFSPVAGRRFDMIVGNPPYIAADDPHLRQGDLRFEPASALASGDDGLDDIRLISAGAPAHMQPGAWLLLEHGFDQGERVRDLFRRGGLTEVQTVQDLESRERVTAGRQP